MIKENAPSSFRNARRKPKISQLLTDSTFVSKDKAFSVSPIEPSLSEYKDVSLRPTRFALWKKLERKAPQLRGKFMSSTGSGDNTEKITVYPMEPDLSEYKECNPETCHICTLGDARRKRTAVKRRY